MGRIEDAPLKYQIGYKVIYKPIVRQLRISFGGIMGELSDSVGAALTEEIIDTLRRGEADVAFFNNLKVDSPIYQHALTIPGFLWRDHFAVDNVHFKLDLPSSLDEFYRSLSRNTRENLRRYSRKLLRTFGENITVKCFQHEHEIEYLMRDIEEIAAKTYQRGLGVGLSNDIETRRRLLLGLQRRWLRAYVLYINNKPCAFWHGYNYCKTFFIGVPGYDPEYDIYRVGHFLHMKMIEDLFTMESIDAIDYGFGDAQYKRSFCNQNWKEASFYLFAPTGKGLKLNLARMMTAGISRIVQTTLKRTRLLTKVKKTLRSRLQNKTI